VDAPLDPVEFAEALWRLRLRGIAAVDGLAARERSKLAREAWDTRPDQPLAPMRGFLCEFGSDSAAGGFLM
jgi:hypothetical protein